MIRGIYNRIMKRPLGINYQIKRGGARAEHIHTNVHLRKQFNVIIGVREYFRRTNSPCLFMRPFTLAIIILNEKK